MLHFCSHHSALTTTIILSLLLLSHSAPQVIQGTTIQIKPCPVELITTVGLHCLPIMTHKTHLTDIEA